VLRLDVEQAIDLVEHLAVLAGDDDRAAQVLGRVDTRDHGRELDRFRPRAVMTMMLYTVIPRMPVGRSYDAVAGSRLCSGKASVTGASTWQRPDGQRVRVVDELADLVVVRAPALAVSTRFHSVLLRYGPGPQCPG